MEVSDVRVRLVNNANDRLKAVCSVTLDEAFVVRDVKIVEGAHGLFVAMPSRKLSAPCPQCGTQNHLRAKHCNECGRRLPATHIPVDEQGREKAHRDMAHPITASFRQEIQDRVLEAYESERGRSAFVEADADKSEREPTMPERDVRTGADESVRHPAMMGPAEGAAEKALENHGTEEVVSEYDAIIADLRGPRPPSHASSGGQQHAHGPDGASGGGTRRRSRRGRRGRRGSERPVSRNGSESARGREDDARQPRKTQERPRPHEKQPRREGEVMPRSGSGVPAGPVETPPTRIVADEARRATPPPAVETNDEPFGAGLTTEPVTAPIPKYRSPAAEPKKVEPVESSVDVQDETRDAPESAGDDGGRSEEDAFGAGLL